MARPRNPTKRLKKLAAPANEAELATYYSACEKVDCEPADTLRKLAAAFAAHVEEHGYVTFPIRFAPPEKRPRGD